MPEILSSGALNRHITEYLTTDKRVKQYKCKTLQNPDYFYNGLVFAPVDVAFSKSAVSTTGSIFLRDKAIVSVGTKRADDAYKFFGLRPDEKQDGSEQFEVSIESIEINGKKQTINLRDRLAVSPITTKFGNNLYIQNARQRTRVMVEATNADDGFKIALRLHLKGLTVTYRADLDEYWIYNEKGQFRFRLGKPYLVDPATMNPLRGELDNPYSLLVKHSLREIGKGEYLYVKEPTEDFGKVKLPDKFLIDANTVYSSTADGWVQRWSGNVWSTCRNNTTGNYKSSTSSYKEGCSASFEAGEYNILRSFFYYSLSGLSGTVQSVLAYLTTYFYRDSTICIMMGTQSDALVTADYNNFSGSEYSGGVAPATDGNPFSLTFNSTGVLDIQNALGATFKACTREYDHDYSDVDPGQIEPTRFCNGIYFADNTGTSKDPYLYITVEGEAVGNPWNYYANQ